MRRFRAASYVPADDVSFRQMPLSFQLTRGGAIGCFDRYIGCFIIGYARHHHDTGPGNRFSRHDAMADLFSAAANILCYDAARDDKVQPFCHVSSPFLQNAQQEQERRNTGTGSFFATRHALLLPPCAPFHFAASFKPMRCYALMRVLLLALCRRVTYRFGLPNSSPTISIAFHLTFGHALIHTRIIRGAIKIFRLNYGRRHIRSLN